MKSYLRFCTLLLIALAPACAPSPLAASPTSIPQLTTGPLVNLTSTPSQPITTELPPIDAPGEIADIIFTDGTIITMDDVNPFAQGIAIRGDKIVAVGSDADMLRLRGQATKVIDLQGRTMLPGFIDSHTHRIGDRAIVGYDSAEQAIQDALAQGWTSLHELFVNQERLDELQDLDRAGQLPLRVYAYLPINAPEGDLYGDWYSAYYPHQVMTPHVTIAGLKINIDQGWGRTASYFTQEQFDEMVMTPHSAGWQIAVHSVGEEASDVVMNAFERALNGESNEKYRHRIEHLIFLRDDQIARLKELGIIASIQLVGPPEWPPDPRFQKLIPLYGEKSVARWKDLLAAGVRTMGSSDTPWMTTGRLNGWNGSPLHLISTAVTRVQYPNETPPAYILAQTITVEQALRMLTIEGAYATFEEDLKGSLAPGKLADLVILSNNPLTTPIEQFPDIQTLMTMIGGQVEYCAAGAETFCPSTVPSNTNAIPIGFIDIPAFDETISGTIEIAGWALDEIKIDRVEIYLDGQFIGKATYGNPRPDVEHDYPGRPGTPNFGFIFNLNTASYSNGPHTIEALAINSSGNNSPLIPKKLTITIHN